MSVEICLYKARPLEQKRCLEKQKHLLERQDSRRTGIRVVDRWADSGKKGGKDTRAPPEARVFWMSLQTSDPASYPQAPVSASRCPKHR